MPDQTPAMKNTGSFHAADAAERERRSDREATAWDAALAAALAAKAAEGTAPSASPDEARAGPAPGTSVQADGDGGAAE